MTADLHEFFCAYQGHFLYFFLLFKEWFSKHVKVKIMIKAASSTIKSYFTFRNYGTKGYCSRGKSSRSSSYYVKEPHRVKQSCPVKQICQTFNAFGQLKYKYFCKCGEDFFWQYHWISKNRKIVMRHVSIINLLYSYYILWYAINKSASFENKIENKLIRKNLTTSIQYLSIFPCLFDLTELSHHLRQRVYKSNKQRKEKNPLNSVYSIYFYNFQEKQELDLHELGLQYQGLQPMSP